MPNSNVAAIPSETQAELVRAARAAQRMAYAPYSRFQVGAAVLDESGRIHAGCNVENAAYPQGVCAEAAALSAMVLGGQQRLRAVAVVGSGGRWITPCGGCRQKLREFGAPDMPIFTANATECGPAYTLAELLPESFGPDHLEARRTDGLADHNHPPHEPLVPDMQPTAPNSDAPSEATS